MRDMEPSRALPLLVLAALLMPVPPSTAADALSGKLAGAASAFLATLAPAERAKVQLAFDSEERFNWFYIPKDREGLPLKQMSPAQQKAALHLIETGLSQKGYSKAEAIRALDLVLAEIEKNPVRRDPEKYYLTLFGEPSPAGTWGMRWEGHHVSLHWTLVNGVAIATHARSFSGATRRKCAADPQRARVCCTPRKTSGVRWSTSLTAEQRAVAVIAPKGARRHPHHQHAQGRDPGEHGAGLQGDDPGAARDAARADRGVRQRSAEGAGGRSASAKLKKAGLDEVKFAWMGGIEKGALHYYRVQGPTFLIEYDCVQNEGNHIHAVWRDFDGDFGVDLLEQHYKKSAHHRGQQ